MKKKILLITDVRGWGGEYRGKQIIKHLSHLYDFDMITATDKMELNYDLYYFLFHPLILNKDPMKLIPLHNLNAVTIVTSVQIYKNVWNHRRKELWNEIKKRCECISANCVIGHNNLKKIYTGKSFCIPRGVDTKEFYFEKWNNVPLTACYVGKPVEEKGLEEIIRPACRIAGVNLITNTRNYTNAIDVNGMRELYNNSHVYIVASTTDGTPNPALEAAACGRPIISNRIGNMPEFIKDTENGFLINRNIDDYVQKLVYMKNNMNTVYQMGQNALQTVKDNWTWDITMKYENEMLEWALNRR